MQTSVPIHTNTSKPTEPRKQNGASKLTINPIATPQTQLSANEMAIDGPPPSVAQSDTTMDSIYKNASFTHIPQPAYICPPQCSDLADSKWQVKTIYSSPQTWKRIVAHNVPIFYNKDNNSRALLATRLMLKYQVALMELPRFLLKKTNSLPMDKRSGSIVITFHPKTDISKFLKEGVFIHGQIRRTSTYLASTSTNLRPKTVTPDTFRYIQGHFLSLIRNSSRFALGDNAIQSKTETQGLRAQISPHIRATTCLSPSIKLDEHCAALDSMMLEDG